MLKLVHSGNIVADNMETSMDTMDRTDDEQMDESKKKDMQDNMA